jgi:hypothetical protein
MALMLSTVSPSKPRQSITIWEHRSALPLVPPNGKRVACQGKRHPRSLGASRRVISSRFRFRCPRNRETSRAFNTV